MLFFFTVSYLFLAEIFVLSEDFLYELEHGHEGRGQDGGHGNDPPDGVGPSGIGIIGALGQGLVADPGYEEDYLKSYNKNPVKFHFWYFKKQHARRTKMMKGESVM